jgi:hypothetical protein
MFALRIAIKTDKLTHLDGSVGKLQAAISQSVQRLVHGLDDSMIVVRFPTQAIYCPLLQNAKLAVQCVSTGYSLG